MHRVKLLAMSEAILVYCAFPNAEEALRMAERLIEARLIACANLLPAGLSVYRWEGKIETAPEQYALFKTESDKYPLVERAIMEHHSYKVPCVLAVPVGAGNAAFLQWIHDEIA